MANKINISKLLKDCPSGMELDCTICNGVKFIELDRNPNFPIVVRANNGYEFTLTKYGQVHNIDDAKCVIFPKGKTTWEGFVPPCNFKDGDIVYTRCDCGDEYIFIFENITKNTCVNSYLHLKGDELRIMKVWLTNCDDKYLRLATEGEKAKLFQALKENGYKWNTKTKTLKKFPKFKVGDRIRQKGETSTYTITDVNNAHYFCGEYVICDTCDNDWELVPNKFDISTLVPFESRVLVRDNDHGEWRSSFWGHLRQKADMKYDTIRGVYKQCIPYEGNEHLLGTTNDCDEYFKNWK